MAGHPELYELRNYFYLGNLSAAWTEGETVKMDEEDAMVEKEVIMARIKLAQGKYDEVIASTSEDTSSDPAMRVTGYVARYMKDAGAVAEGDKEAMHALLSDEKNYGGGGNTSRAAAFATMGGILYFYMGDTDNALRALSRVETLDTLSLAVHILLSIDRADEAEKILAGKMAKIDEDATLTQLAGAWIKLQRVGGSTDVSDALYIFQDLLERHGATDTILNGLALCHLAAGRDKLTDAEKCLQEAISKNPNHPSTLVNAIISAKYRNKPNQLVDRYLEQLRKVAHNSQWLKDYCEKESEFDTLAAQLEAA